MLEILEKIANICLKNGNGNESSGDGWKYRVAEPLQPQGIIHYKSLCPIFKEPEVLCVQI
jgi:predicted chitinase